ncbi:MAG: alpha/beta hydrolase [Actinomycetota bacterium]|nr:alpha/beta hydrolase [Actinomycetota bacterium]
MDDAAEPVDPGPPMASALDETPGPPWFTAALAAERRVGTVDVDGCAINYLEWGDRSKPHVLLVHGFLAHARCFEFVAPLLAPNLHVVAMDLSGMGDSGHRPTYRREDRVAEVVAVAGATGMLDGPAPAFLVTHSYGSTIGIDTFEADPTTFAGFVLCDLMMLPPDVLSAWMGGGNEEARLSRGVARPHRTHPDLTTALSRYRLSPPQPCANGWAVRHIGRHSLREVEGGWQWKFDPQVLVDDEHGPDWWIGLPPRFAALATRKAEIHGADSMLMTPAAVDYVRGLTGPSVPFIPIPAAHHHLFLDQPIAYAAALSAVITTWAATPG